MAIHPFFERLRTVAHPLDAGRGAPPRTVARIAGGLFLAAFLAGCGDGATGPGLPGDPPDYQSAVVVRGSVVDIDGREVFGTTIRVRVEEWDGGCSGVQLGETFEGELNEIGDFSLTLTFDRDEFDACLTVEAVPPPDSNLQPGTQSRIDVAVNEPGNIRTYEFPPFVLLP